MSIAGKCNFCYNNYRHKTIQKRLASVRGARCSARVLNPGTSDLSVQIWACMKITVFFMMPLFSNPFSCVEVGRTAVGSSSIKYQVQPDGHGLTSPLPVPKTQSAFHPHVQRNASRHRDTRQQSRLLARWNQSLTRSPSSNRPF